MTSPIPVHLYALEDKPANGEEARLLLPRLRACLTLLRAVKEETEAGEFAESRAVPLCIREYVMTCRDKSDDWYVYAVLCHDPATQTIRECLMDCTLAFEWRKRDRSRYERFPLGEVAKAVANVEKQIRDAEELSVFDFGAAIARVRQRAAANPSRAESGNIVLERYDPGPRRSYPHWKEWDFDTVELSPDNKVYRCSYTENDYGCSKPELNKRSEINGAELMYILRFHARS